MALEHALLRRREDDAVALFVDAEEIDDVPCAFRERADARAVARAAHLEVAVSTGIARVEELSRAEEDAHRRRIDPGLRRVDDELRRLPGCRIDPHEHAALLIARDGLRVERAAVVA